MADVFGFAVRAGGEFLQSAAIDAAYELGIFDRLGAGEASLDELADAAGLGRGRRRLRPLLDVLAALGAISRVADRFAAGTPPPRPVVARAGWGLMAEVFRRDRALDVDGGDVELRYHRHLFAAGAGPARALAPSLLGDPPTLLDIGGGAGAYTAGFLEAHPAARATLVDFDEVIALARFELARFGDRVRYVVGEARMTPNGDGFGAALLANVLHLHAPKICEDLVGVAARAVAPSGIVAIKELRVDDDRSGPLEGLLFALNMAIYTGEGDVYTTSQLRAWLAGAGLVDITELRLDDDGMCLLARRPATS